MPEPRRPNIWTPRQRHTYFPSKLGWMLPPSKPYVVPPPPPASLKSSRFDFFVSADDTTAQASASELKSLADGWLTTAKALKAQIPGAQEPLPAPGKKSSPQAAAAAATAAAAAALPIFDSSAFAHERAEISRLERNAARAFKAIESLEQAKNATEKLIAFKASAVKNTGAKLGNLLLMRQVKIGNIVGTWSHSRDLLHRGEVSKAEFRHEVLHLGLQATSQEVDELFDSIDRDGSGWLDVEEVKVGLRVLYKTAVDTARTLMEMERRVHTLQHHATRSITKAVNPPPLQARGLASESGDSTADEGDSPPSRAPLKPPSAKMMERLMPKERSARDIERAAEEKATMALKRMGQLLLAKGFATWLAAAQERAWKMQQLQRGLRRLLHKELVRGWNEWNEWYVERCRLLGLLLSAAARLVKRNLLRGWEAWGDWLEMQAEIRRRMERCQKILRQIRNPELAHGLDRWRRNWEDSSPRPGPLALLCRACAKCTGRRRYRYM